MKPGALERSFDIAKKFNLDRDEVKLFEKKNNFLLMNLLKFILGHRDLYSKPSIAIDLPEFNHAI